MRPGFYSQLFLVPKKDGGLRSVINPRPLNRFEHQPEEVQDADSQRYHQFPPQGRMGSRYRPRGRVFPRTDTCRFASSAKMRDSHRRSKSKGLPVCCHQTSAPRVFTRVGLPLAGWAHLRGVHLIPYTATRRSSETRLLWPYYDMPNERKCTLIYFRKKCTPTR